jgi:hypothetical protein
MFHQPLSIWLSLVAVAVAVHQTQQAQVAVAVQAGIGTRYLVKIAVVAHQPKALWRLRLA